MRCCPWKTDDVDYAALCLHSLSKVRALCLRPCNTKGHSSTYLAMRFANVRAGTQRRRALFVLPCPQSGVDFDSPSHARHPLFRNASRAAIDVELVPGDVLFIPAYVPRYVREVFGVLL